MRVLVYGDNAGMINGAANLSVLTDLLAARGAIVQRVGDDTAKLQDPGYDCADLRSAGIEDLSRIIPGIYESVSILISPDVFLSVDTVREFTGILGLHSHPLFIEHPWLYEPVFLELGRYLRGRPPVPPVSCTLHVRLSGGRFSDRYPVLLRWLDLVSFLFGPAKDVLKINSAHSETVEKSSVSFVSATGTVRADLTMQNESCAESGIQGSGRYETADECIGFLFGTAADRLTVRPERSESRTMFTAEGSGNYYLALDLFESVSEKRPSGIITISDFLNIRCSSIGLFSGMRGMRDTE